MTQRKAKKKAAGGIQPATATVKDAGVYLGVSAATVRRMIQTGTVPHVRVGDGARSVRLRICDLDRYLDARTSTKWEPHEPTSVHSRAREGWKKAK